MALKAAIVPVTPFQQNCCLLWEEATMEGVVVDPGGEVPRILAAISELKLNVHDILLTHGHIDHAGGAAALRRELGVPLLGPDERDRFLLEGLAEQGAKYGLEDAEDVLPDRWLAEGETVAIGGHDFALLHCPGHSPGSLVYVSVEDQVALVGDVLFRGSIGRTDFSYGDHAALLAAIHGKLLPLGDDIGFVCGHGPGSTFGHERKRNPFLLREQG